MKYEIIKYRPEFRNQVVKLQKHLWSQNITWNSAYLHWKYERNPYYETPLIYLALLNNQVVGMRGFYGALWQAGMPAEILPCSCAGDLVIDPEHRDRGLFTKIMQAALQDLSRLDCKYVFNLSANHLTHLGALAMGWQSIGTLQTMRWVARPDQLTATQRVRKRLNRPSKLRKGMNKALNWVSPKSTDIFRHFDRKILPCERMAGRSIRFAKLPQPKAMASLVKRVDCDKRIKHVRDEQYFRWRFGNPLSKYRFLFMGESTLEGYLVLQSSLTLNQSEVNVVDWEATDSKVLGDMLNNTIQFGGFVSLNIRTAVFIEQMRDVLKESGFRSIDHRSRIRNYHPTVLVRPVDESLSRNGWTLAGTELLELSNWNLRMIYSDGY